MPDDEQVAGIQLRMEGKLVLGAIQKYLDAARADDAQENGLLQYSEIEKLAVELNNFSLAKASRLRAETEKSINAGHNQSNLSETSASIQ